MCTLKTFHDQVQNAARVRITAPGVAGDVVSAELSEQRDRLTVSYESVEGVGHIELEPNDLAGARVGPKMLLPDVDDVDYLFTFSKVAA